jgi:hypothetical protein
MEVNVTSPQPMIPLSEDQVQASFSQSRRPYWGLQCPQPPPAQRLLKCAFRILHCLYFDVDGLAASALASLHCLSRPYGLSAGQTRVIFPIRRDAERRNRNQKVRDSMRSFFAIYLMLPAASGSTQPLTETSTRNIRGGNERLARRATNLTAICGSLDVPQPQGPP